MKTLTPASLYQERPGRTPSPELAGRREQLANMVAAGTFHTEPAPHEERCGSVRMLRFGSPHRPCATVLHFHGGGFRQGCPEMIAPFASALAKHCNVDVLCPAYRLAPDHPFPAALNDGWNVIASDAHVGPLILSGDSAGAGLAASLTADATTRRIPIVGLCLLSPWLDLTVTSDCYEINAHTDTIFSCASAREAADLYLQGEAPRDPRVSPLFAPLAGFPPTFIGIGTGEVLADDARRMHAALCAIGIDATLHAVPQMEHAAVTRNLALSGAAEMFAALTRFIDAVLDLQSNAE